METTLLTLGVLLVLVGLIGQIKAKEIEVGTKNPLVRIILGVVGAIFVYMALSKSYVISNAPGLTETPTFMSPTQMSVQATDMPTLSTDTPLQESNTPALFTSPQDCLPYDSSSLRIVNEGDSGWLLTDTVSRMLVLDNEQDATDALALASRHTEHCFIGRDNTRSNREEYVVEYWIGNSGLATTIMQPDCISYNPMNLQILDEGASGWLLTDGTSRMLILNNEQDAQSALILAKQYTNQCFIGRGNTRTNRDDYIVQYWE